MFGDEQSHGGRSNDRGRGQCLVLVQQSVSLAQSKVLSFQQLLFATSHRTLDARAFQLVLRALGTDLRRQEPRFVLLEVDVLGGKLRHHLVAVLHGQSVRVLEHQGVRALRGGHRMVDVRRRERRV